MLEYTGIFEQQSQGIVLPSPLAHWPLNETSGTTASDTSGNGFHGTIAGGPTFLTDGIRGNAIRLEGAGDYIDFGDFFYSDTLTMACWINLTVGTSTDKNIAVKRNSSGVTSGSPVELWLRCLANETMNYRCYKGATVTDLDLTSTTVLVPGTWYHVVVSQHGNGVTSYLYINGTQEASGTQTDVMTNTTHPFQLGVRTANNDATYLQGMIHDFWVFNTPLTAAQVLKLYQDTTL